MRSTGSSKEFSEVLREHLQINSQDFQDLFSTGKSRVFRGPELRHELARIKSPGYIGRSQLLDIKI